MMFPSVLEHQIARLLEAQWSARRWTRRVARRAAGREDAPKVEYPALGRLLREAHQLTGVTQDLAGQRILVVGYLTYWIDFFIAVSATLIARGADVTFAWLPEFTFDRATKPLERSRLRVRYEAVFGDGLERFRAVDLSRSARASISPQADETLRRFAKIDAQYCTRRESVDLEGEHREIFELRRETLTSMYASTTSLLASGRYDNVIIPSGGILDYSAAFQAAVDLDVPVVTFECWERYGKCVICPGRPFMADMGRDAWAADSKVLDDARRRRVSEWMAKREGTKWEDYVLPAYQRSEVVSPESVREQLGLDARPIVLVCPNVPFDAAYLGLSGSFETMAEWLRELSLRLAQRSDCQVVVRAHPGEVDANCAEGALELVQRAIGTPPSHFRLIGPLDKVNTYSLMRAASLGLVFGSTAGLEMPMRGLPVVMPIQAHYSRKGFTIDAFTAGEYFAAIDKSLADPQHFRLSQEMIDTAWCYFDCYHNSWPKPFPWMTLSLARDLREWPLRRVLSPAGLEAFGESFTALARGRRASELPID
jgi:hypothetical protein